MQVKKCNVVVWWVLWWILSRVVGSGASIGHPALGVMLNSTLGLGSVDAISVQADDYKAHFLKRGMYSDLDFLIYLMPSIRSIVDLGGVYQLSGFAHISMEIKLSAYRKAVQNGCGALHQISCASRKPGLSHLYGAIESMETRCKRLEQVANSQLRAMVSFKFRLVC